jgi:hypothetical protein
VAPMPAGMPSAISVMSAATTRPRRSGGADESEVAVRSAFDAFLSDFLDRARRGSLPDDGPDKPVMLVASVQVSPAAAERIKTRVSELTQTIADAEAGDVVAVGFYQPEP